MGPGRLVRKAIKATGALALALALAGCPGSDPVAFDGDIALEGVEGPTRRLILLLDNVPQPGYLVIKHGEIVEWRNAGNHEHSVSTYGTPDEWDDTLLQPGQTFLHTFSEPGEYAYICVVHAEVGTVVVVEDMEDY